MESEELTELGPRRGRLRLDRRLQPPGGLRIVRFGRKRAAETEDDRAGRRGDPAPRRRARGPPRRGSLRRGQVDLEDHEGIDLGSLVVTPGDDMELQLQVDETSGEVAAVVLVGDDGRPGAARVRGLPGWRGLGRAAAPDRGRGDPAGRHGDGAGRHLRPRAAVPGADADPRRPGRRPGEPDHRPRGAGLVAAGHPDRPAGRRGGARRTPGTRRSGGSSYAGDARRRPPGAALPLRLPPEARRIE